MTSGGGKNSLSFAFFNIFAKESKVSIVEVEGWRWHDRKSFSQQNKSLFC